MSQSTEDYYKEEFETDLPSLPHELDDILSEMKEFLLGKNQKYGNSALEPIRAFSSAGMIEQLLVRIDDKISRVLQGGRDPNNEKDLLGYLLMLRVAERREALKNCSKDLWHGDSGNSAE